MNGKKKKLGKVMAFAVPFLMAATMLSQTSADTGMLDIKDTRFVAHRGLSSQYYENTTQSFTAAGESNFFYGIETDIRKTADGEFVCAHDENPFADKTKLVQNVTLDQALQLPLKNSKTPEYIATFEDFLDICSQYGKNAFIHFKIMDISESDAKKILDILCEKEMLEASTFLSYSQNDLNRIKELYPNANVQILYSLLNNKLEDFNLDENISTSTNKFKLSISQFEKAKENGCEVAVWTVNDKQYAQELIDKGVDYITTNRDFSKGKID